MEHISNQSAAELSPAPSKSVGNLLARARAFARQRARDQRDTVLPRAEAIAAIVEQLGVDEQIVAGATLYPLAESDLVSHRVIADEFGSDLALLVRELVRLGSFGFPANWQPEKGLSAGQAETLRKMLLAIVADARLVLVRLADQLYRLRAAKTAPDEERQRVALETREIYAPLANRLGIWQLKWELEDLTFRYLEPDTYKNIAASLRESRTKREGLIRKVKDELQEELAQAHIAADIEGRPKHIYSIWRKMHRKQIEFAHVFDIHAVRVLVDTVADCYAVLGIVHSRWPYVPGEFDDYIATPKDNFYRSLHTAVIGPAGKALEIQIRTREMHEHAELGVAAHWRYKEGGRRNPAFEEKITWLRKVLEPAEQGESERDFIDRVKSEIFEDRVYAISPKGDVVDLPKGATPIDFAYHVHTEIGHHCRGARVNGRMVALDYRIANGDQIEILTARSARPSRDWLIPQLGYLASSRSRSKVRNWFRRQDMEQNKKQGRAMLERELQRLGARNTSLETLARELRIASVDKLYTALGAGDVTLAAVAGALQRTTDDSALRLPSPRRRAPLRPSTGPISVAGIGDMMSNFARCCRPVPPESIAGYVTLGRGVSIHRRDCANMLRLAEHHPERVLAVEWSGGDTATYPVDIHLEAYDRHGLLRDISTLLADEKVNIIELTTRTDKSTNCADIELSVAVSGLDELSRLLHRLGSVPNVFSVQRRN